MAVSAVNVPKTTARRLKGYRFLLDIVFQQDGAPWNVSALPIKIDITLSNDAFVKTWTAADFSYPATNIIHLDYKTPALAGLPDSTQSVQYKCTVYLDEIAGKQPLLSFDLYVDPSINSGNQSDYSTGPYAAEALVLNVVSTIPGVTVEVAAGWEIRVLALEQRVDELETVLAMPVRQTLEEIEEEATGEVAKTWALLQDGNIQIIYYVPGADDLVSPFVTSVGGSPSIPTGLTHSQRIAALEANTYLRVLANTYADAQDEAVGTR
ncbi:hypothetical protein, partial [Larkinella ripae]